MAPIQVSSALAQVQRNLSWYSQNKKKQVQFYKIRVGLNTQNFDQVNTDLIYQLKNTNLGNFLTTFDQKPNKDANIIIQDEISENLDSITEQEKINNVQISIETSSKLAQDILEKFGLFGKKNYQDNINNKKTFSEFQDQIFENLLLVKQDKNIMAEEKNAYINQKISYMPKMTAMKVALIFKYNNN
ncbi:hypothetical protein PPERSA_12538 [Pseudocohnilembus persalinus]|uniref:Uncharacterized protein n=1 Tax=Pseudocohnilembus persalinus TaxID=266149 RepID=A0A0V0QB92_PSEPJ|nr:hypothetical protein PPERSA_12538 [Pseudocohnilembus persalinus]|eukprot:KRW99434.1 hypothetical protein PPERSA_12538 [Pseudocohnilembus persalinus]